MYYRHLRRDPSSNRRNLIFHKHVAALVGCVILAVTPGTASPQSPAQGDKEFSTLPFTAERTISDIVALAMVHISKAEIAGDPHFSELISKTIGERIISRGCSP